jgi:hypothetical protein
VQCYEANKLIPHGINCDPETLHCLQLTKGQAKPQLSVLETGQHITFLQTQHYTSTSNNNQISLSQAKYNHNHKQNITTAYQSPKYRGFSDTPHTLAAHIPSLLLQKLHFDFLSLSLLDSVTRRDCIFCGSTASCTLIALFAFHAIHASKLLGMRNNVTARFVRT